MFHKFYIKPEDRDYCRFVKIKLMQKKIRHVNLTGSCLQDFHSPFALNFRVLYWLKKNEDV